MTDDRRLFVGSPPILAHCALHPLHHLCNLWPLVSGWGLTLIFVYPDYPRVPWPLTQKILSNNSRLDKMYKWLFFCQRPQARGQGQEAECRGLGLGPHLQEWLHGRPQLRGQVREKKTFFNLDNMFVKKQMDILLKVQRQLFYILCWELLDNSSCV